ncbi:helix-turn-helix domain-containing protein [Streptomyces sp. CA-250714]|uniref:helix-turn-helix domain-containing protein n=1 Tax=Streptomyces sp. CA-250714 TaxID=3240060 RepID=UPI003D920745
MITDIESATPALCRLQLGSELRQLRQAAGLNGRQVVRKLLWSSSKLTRLETGDNASVEPSDVIALCQIYGATAEQRAVLEGYAAVTKTRRDWWQSAEYRPVIRPGFKAYLGLEATASAFQTYASEFVPGLLQTEAYVRAIYANGHQALSAEEVDSLVTVRMTRQEALLRTESPLKLTAIINEAVLRRAVGGPKVIRGQLGHIVDVVTARPNVRVQVVPFKLGLHPAMSGPFVVLRFSDRAVPRHIVYLENLAGAWVYRKEGDVERYVEAFADLQALAPGPHESLNLIKKAVKEH